MIEKKFISQKGFMSTSFEKNIALFFAFANWREDGPLIPVLIQIKLTATSDYLGLDELE